MKNHSVCFLLKDEKLIHLPLRKHLVVSHNTQGSEAESLHLLLSVRELHKSTTDVQWSRPIGNPIIRGSPRLSFKWSLDPFTVSHGHLGSTHTYLWEVSFLGDIMRVHYSLLEFCVWPCFFLTTVFAPCYWITVYGLARFLTTFILFCALDLFACYCVFLVFDSRFVFSTMFHLGC